MLSANPEDRFSQVAAHLEGNTRFRFEQLAPESGNLDGHKDTIQIIFPKDETIKMNIYLKKQQDKFDKLISPNDGLFERNM